MYATFSYDIGSGSHANEKVLEKILEKFDALPSGAERRRCHLLGDTFICEVANLNDFEGTNLRLARLRTELSEQFSYAFSLHSRNAPLKVRGPHNAALAREILEA